MLVIIDDTAINPDQIIYVEPDGSSGCTVYMRDYDLSFDNITVEKLTDIINRKGTLLLTEEA